MNERKKEKGKKTRGGKRMESLRRERKGRVRKRGILFFLKRKKMKNKEESKKETKKEIFLIKEENLYEKNLKKKQ